MLCGATQWIALWTVVQINELHLLSYDDCNKALTFQIVDII